MVVEAGVLSDFEAQSGVVAALQVKRVLALLPFTQPEGADEGLDSKAQVRERDMAEPPRYSPALEVDHALYDAHPRCCQSS